MEGTPCQSVPRIESQQSQGLQPPGAKRFKRLIYFTDGHKENFAKMVASLIEVTKLGGYDAEIDAIKVGRAAGTGTPKPKRDPNAPKGKPGRKPKQPPAATQATA